MDAELIRKLIDKLREVELMEEPPAGPPSQEFINQLDQSHSTGSFNKSQFDNSSADQQAMLLRNVNQFKQTNPNYDSSQQGAEARAATVQNQIDTGKITQGQAAQNKGSGEYFTKPQPAPTQTTNTKPVAQAPVTKPAPQPAPGPQQAPSGSALDFNNPNVVNKNDPLKFGMSTSASGVDPKLYAGLDVGDNGRLGYKGGVNGTHQLSYTHNISPNLSAQAALNQNAQGGRSAGGSLNYQISPNTSISGSLEKDITGNQGLRAGVNLAHKF